MAEIKIAESQRFPTALTIDEDKGVIYGVKVLGEVSKNNLLFPRNTRTLAHTLIEGAKVNLNHTPKGQTEVQVERRFGKLANPAERDDGTYCDLHYVKTHPFAPTLVEMAKNHPDLVGFSIRGGGSGKSKDSEGRKIVESIDNLESVDLVSDPANTVALNEAVESPSATPGATEPTTETSENGGEHHYWQACENACLDILRSDLPVDKKLAEIESHLSHFEELYGEEAEESEEEAEEESVEESVKKLLEKHKIPLSEGKLIANLVRVPAAFHEDVVKQFKRSRLARKPNTAGRPKNDGKFEVRESAKETPATADVDEASYTRILTQLRP